MGNAVFICPDCVKGESMPSEPNAAQKDPHKWTQKKKYADIAMTLYCFLPEMEAAGVIPTAKLEPEPDNYWTWLKRADDHMDFDEYQPALDCYEKSLVALRENPPPWDRERERRTVLRLRSRALSRLKRHDEALHAFDEVMEL